MLGTRIPILWNKTSETLLTKELGFDVENPMILAEMSRILAKETKAKEGSEVNFTPEVIDLNTAFNLKKNENKPKEQSGESIAWYVWIIAFVIIVIISGILIFVIQRKNNN